MKRIATSALALGIFVAGIGIGVAAQRVSSDLYQGKSPHEAATALVDEATEQADGGSWEMIGIGRVLYLGGQKSKGEAMFNAILNGDHEDSDVFRIARFYAQNGEWEKAKPLFDRYIDNNPREAQDLAEVGAFYLLNGDRKTAESLFDRSFVIKRDIWATLYAAGAYLGVHPQSRVEADRCRAQARSRTSHESLCDFQSQPVRLGLIAVTEQDHGQFPFRPTHDHVAKADGFAGMPKRIAGDAPAKSILRLIRLAGDFHLRAEGELA